MTASRAPVAPVGGLTGVQVAPLVALALLVPAQLYLAIPLSPTFGEAFGVDDAAAVWAGSAFAIAYAVGFLVFGPLSDQVGRRAVLVVGTVATAVATVLAGVATEWEVFLACRALQGFAASSFAPVALVLVAERVAPERRATVMTAVTGGLLGAGVVGQAVGALAVDAWRLPFWVGAVCYATTAFVLARLLPPDRPVASTSWRGAPRTMARLATTWPAVAVFAAAPTVFGGFVAVYAVLGPHLAATTGITASGQVGVRAVGAIALVVAPVVSGLLSRRGPRHVPVAGFLTAAVGMVVALAGADLPVIAVAGSVVVVAGMGLAVPGLVGLLHTLVPAAAGTAIAVNTCVLFAGAALAQPLAASLGYRPTLITYTVGLVAAAVLVGTSARPSGGTS
jgi:predicted MFS family arabinose efflux permease